MANPQKENGYTAIANSILEALRGIRIPGESRQVLDCIIRQTYGYHKKTDDISLSQFSEWTGLKTPEVCRALAKLQVLNLITTGKKANDGKTIAIYGLNKNYDSWKPLAKKPRGTGKKANDDPKKPLCDIEGVLAKKPDTKDIILKENIQKKEGNAPMAHTPSQTANSFFKGVRNLRDRSESSEMVATRDFLRKLESKYQGVGKDALWREIQAFERYWTERNSTGSKERWQMQKTFEVDRRLSTWFGKVKEFQTKASLSPINKYRVGSVQKKQ